MSSKLLLRAEPPLPVRQNHGSSTPNQRAFGCKSEHLRKNDSQDRASCYVKIEILERGHFVGRPKQLQELIEAAGSSVSPGVTLSLAPLPVVAGGRCTFGCPVRIHQIEEKEGSLP